MTSLGVSLVDSPESREAERLRHALERAQADLALANKNADLLHERLKQKAELVETLRQQYEDMVYYWQMRYADLTRKHYALKCRHARKVASENQIAQRWRILLAKCSHFWRQYIVCVDEPYRSPTLSDCRRLLRLH